MTHTVLKKLFMIGLLLLVGGFGGCSIFEDPPEPEEDPRIAAGANLPRTRRLTGRPPVNTSRNIYEGSLWRGASSWGNLLRDHRARYRGDLLTVTDLNKIIKVPEVKPEEVTPIEQAQQQAEQQAQQQQGPVDPLEIFLKEQEKRRELIDREQNDILRSIDMIEVEVVGVLPNGNLRVRGVHPPIFRDRNRVKYVVTVSGIVRPSSVDDNNTLPAPKLSKAEYKIRRLVKYDGPPIGSLARAAGQERTGNMLDRFADMMTDPGIDNRNTQVSPK